MNERDWTALLRDLHDAGNVEVMVSAAERLHRTATEEDLPRLSSLLKEDSVFVREAAAWPLSELGGPAALPELFEAFQRGLDEGHDNDGFSAALIELAAAHPEGVRSALEALAKSPDPALQANVTWLMEFCQNQRDA